MPAAGLPKWTTLSEAGPGEPPQSIALRMMTSFCAAIGVPPAAREQGIRLEFRESSAPSVARSRKRQLALTSDKAKTFDHSQENQGGSAEIEAQDHYSKARRVFSKLQRSVAMRKLLTAFTLFGLLTAVVSAADKKDAKTPDKADKKDAKNVDAPKENEAPRLKVGDAPPQLKVSKWLQGAAVRAFDPGKTYVVEFWATWCGPCIMMMPHMGELQAEYKDKGVTIIGYSAKDPRNTAEKVAEFVGKRGPKLGYTFAYGDNRDTYEAWMTAAHQEGIPCSFVISPKGKIAYIGHPLFLGIVLPKVIDGSWNAEHGAAEVAQIDKEFDDVFSKLRDPKPETALKTLADFEQKRPELAKLPFFV